MIKKQSFRQLLVQQQILTILLFTFVVIMIWVISSIYFSYSKTTLTTTDKALIAPLNPRLDSTLFEKLAARKAWNDQELSSFEPRIELPTLEIAETAGTSSIPAVTPAPVPDASASATPIASDSASVTP